MASKKKESEGIALLSMYGDEDDDDMEQDSSDNEALPVEQNEAADMDEDDKVADDKSFGYGNSVDANDNRTPVSIDRLTSPPAQQVIGAEPSRCRKGTLTIVDYGHDEAALSPEPEFVFSLKKVHLSSVSLFGNGAVKDVNLPHVPTLKHQRKIGLQKWVVDMNMILAYEGEIAATGRVMFGAELQTVNGL
ncbi:hypothetical protein Tco_0916585 [Tanacetum coccineum]